MRYVRGPLREELMADAPGRDLRALWAPRSNWIKTEFYVL